MKRWIIGVLAMLSLSGCAQSVAPVAEVEPMEPVVETVVETTVETVIPEPEPEIEYHYVALTFDDGPVANTAYLLDELAARDVEATFFCLGIQATKYPEIIQRIVDEGHQLCSHSDTHLNMTKVDEEVWQADFQTVKDKFNAILETENDYWLRPPYGLINRSQYSLIDVPMVLWSVDPRDWELLDAEAVTTAVLETVEPYDIILLHDTYKTSVEAALAIIDQLQAENYRFVTVETLLELGGIEAEPGVIYRAASGANDTIWYGS